MHVLASHTATGTMISLSIIFTTERFLSKLAGVSDPRRTQDHRQQVHRGLRRRGAPHRADRRQSRVAGAGHLYPDVIESRSVRGRRRSSRAITSRRAAGEDEAQADRAAGAGTALAAPPQEPRAPRRNTPSGKGGLIFTERLYPNEEHKIALSAQSGLKYIILDVSPVLDNVSRERYVETLEQVKSQLHRKGLGIAGIESHPAEPGIAPRSVSVEQLRLQPDGATGDRRHHRDEIATLGGGLHQRARRAGEE